MQYPDSVQFLYSLGNEIKTVKFGLESIREVLRELGDPQRAFRTIHVAGTNGKGSTSAMIEGALRNSGVRTGLYTSPHLVEPTERIRIAGESVSSDDFVRAFTRVHEVNERLLAAGRLETHTTYFETVTAMGFLLLAEAKVDIAVVEVGLGGRLDATNVVEPHLTVITPIDFDHEVWLGNSLEEIAGEKAGILKPGVAAIIAKQRPEAQAVIERRAAELGCELVLAEDSAIRNLHVDARGSEFDCPEHVICPLPGRHQVDNALTAAVALRRLGVPPDFSGVTWPARLQYIQSSPDIIVDGAHNPAGARALAAYIREFLGDKPLHLVYGAMRDKSVQEITEILFPMAQEVILTAPASPRAVRPEALAVTLDHPNVRICPTSADALRAARELPPDSNVVITGSLYLAGEILALPDQEF